MHCQNCGQVVTGAERFCPGCGAPQDVGLPAPEGRSASLAPAPRATIDFGRLGAGDVVVGASLVVLFLALFLPWYAVPGFDPPTASALGTSAGGWRVLILLVTILLASYLFARTMLQRPPPLPLPHWQLLCVVTSLNGLLVLLAFFVKPPGYSSWGYGAVIGVAAAAIAIVGAVLRSRQPELISPQRPVSGAPQHGSLGTPPTATGGPPGLCRACGVAVPPSNRFCNGCGAPVR